MQRINWFPDPNITGTVKPEAGNNANINYPIVNNRNWLRVTSTATGDSYAQYNLSGSQLPHAGSYHVHASIYAQKGEAAFMVFVNVNGSYRPLLSVPVGNGQTVVVDRTISVPSGCDWMLVRISLNGQPVGAIGMMSDILIERADTYDTAVGGASGLLLRRHHATRLTPAVGVMSGDGQEHLSDTGYECSAQTRKQRYGFMQSDSGKRLLCAFLGYSFRPRHSENILWRRDYVHAGRAVYRPVSSIDKHDENSNGSRVRQSDRHSDEYARLHVGRVSGEQDPARRHRIFRREHDAARLTLLGVVA